jgi:hypothetical protein
LPDGLGLLRGDWPRDRVMGRRFTRRATEPCASRSSTGGSAAVTGR